MPSASTGARPARPTSNLYADGIVVACCYGIFGVAVAGAPRWPFERFSSCDALCFVFHPCPACRVRRRELWDSSIGWSLIVAIWLQSVQSQGRASTAHLANCLPRRRNDVAYHACFLITWLTVPLWVDPPPCSTPDCPGGTPQLLASTLQQPPLQTTALVRSEVSASFTIITILCEHFCLLTLSGIVLESGGFLRF